MLIDAAASLPIIFADAAAADDARCYMLRCCFSIASPRYALFRYLRYAMMFAATTPFFTPRHDAAIASLRRLLLPDISSAAAATTYAPPCRAYHADDFAAALFDDAFRFRSLLTPLQIAAAFFFIRLITLLLLISCPPLLLMLIPSLPLLSHCLRHAMPFRRAATDGGSESPEIELR